MGIGAVELGVQVWRVLEIWHCRLGEFPDLGRKYWRYGFLEVAETKFPNRTA